MLEITNIFKQNSKNRKNMININIRHVVTAAMMNREFENFIKMKL